MGSARKSTSKSTFLLQKQIREFAYLFLFYFKPEREMASQGKLPSFKHYG